MSELLNYLADEKNINELSDSCFDTDRRYIQMKRIFCNDGFNISVQAGCGMYCTPRYTMLRSERLLYREVEAGYPSEPEPLIAEYAEDKEPERLTNTVYPYVPVELIDEVLKKHGGIKEATNE